MTAIFAVTISVFINALSLKIFILMFHFVLFFILLCVFLFVSFDSICVLSGREGVFVSFERKNKIG